MVDSATPDMIQQPLPLAFVNGEAMVEQPHDLYIPPDALKVNLERFAGPLDLLLYLIRKQKLDIVDLPIFDITTQYMTYVDVMVEVNLELAAEYLLMAALLAEIKSRLLLPQDAGQDEEIDPRAELVRRLQEYEVIKHAAQALDGIPRMQRDTYPAQVLLAPDVIPMKPLPSLSLPDLVKAMQHTMARQETFAHHHISREALSTRARMTAILARLDATQYMALTDLYTVEEGKAGCVVSFLAVLELNKAHLIECLQDEPYSPIYLRLVNPDEN